MPTQFVPHRGRFEGWAIVDESPEVKRGASIKITSATSVITATIHKRRKQPDSSVKIWLEDITETVATLETYPASGRCSLMRTYPAAKEVARVKIEWTQRH
jgi:hypothetical protein